MLGKYIIEQEQQGAKRAKYGAKVIDSLSTYLMEEYALYLPDKKLLQKKLKEWLAEEQDKTSSITY